MRLPLIVPADLSLEQRPVEDMRAGIKRSFQGIPVHRREWRRRN